MILVRNKQKIKTSDDDYMLHYLKYSHLENKNDEFDF